MSFNLADALVELNIALGDTASVTFTAEEKTRALTKAWRDAYVVTPVRDSSLVYASTTSSYTIPSTVTTVKDMYVITDSSLPEQPVDAGLFRVEDRTIRFSPNAPQHIPDGATIVIYGNYKPTISDSIDSDKMMEYIVALAGYETLTLLGYKKANLFLKNDTTMGELITLRREFKQDVKEMRLQLSKQFESA